MKNRQKKILLLLGDIASFLIAMTIVVLVESSGSLFTDQVTRHLSITVLLTPLWVIIFFVEGLYSLRTFNKNGLIVSLLRATVLSGVSCIIFLYLFSDYVGVTPKTNLVYFSCLSFIFTYTCRKIFFKVFSYKVFMKGVTFVGEAKNFEEIQSALLDKPHLGYSVDSKINCFSKLHDASSSQLVIVEDKLLRSEKVGEGLFEVLNSGTSVLALSDFSEVVLGKIPLEAIDHNWFIDSKISIESGTFYHLKKAVDLVLAITFTVLFLPIFLLLIPLLLITSGRPILYSQKRVGLNNHEYLIYKLRSMKINSEASGAQWASVNDNRITPMGTFLRKSRLDEIPQVWNVLNGTMSFVGPRPERKEIIEEKLHDVIPFYNYRHLVKPGITGWAQVHYGYGASQEDSLTKLRYDLYYVKNRSIWLDFRIILKTIKTVLDRIGR